MSGANSPVLVTGASGFIGKALLARMTSDGILSRAATRHELTDLPAGVQVVQGSDLGSGFDWSPALSGCNAVIHAAGRAHHARDSTADPIQEFRRVNVDGTVLIARQAANARVRRFVYLSSIKVNGERTLPGRPFTTD